MKAMLRSLCRRLFFSGSAPGEIVLEVTDRCNLDCFFCFNKLYVADRGKRAELGTTQLKFIIDKIQSSGVDVIRFTGGEPLLRKDIFDLMEHARKKKLKVWLNTNGTLIDRANAQRIADCVDDVLIPLNAYSAAHEKSVTGTDSFKRKFKSIRLLKKSGLKRIRCGTIATKENIINFDKIYEIVRRLEVFNWELFRPIPLSRDALTMDHRDLALLVEKLLTLKRFRKNQYKIANALPFCGYDPDKVARVSLGGGFDDGHSRFVVDTAGIARPMYYLTENIGDIFRDSVPAIWNNAFMRQMRALKFMPPECLDCRYARMCKGGSRIVSRIMHGDYRKADYLSRPMSARPGKTR
jgi:radical SAM protein with 4Fe4S-binding SPASM domain